MSHKLTDSREGERERIDETIAKIEAELIALKRRRNSLAPIATLPPNVLLLVFGLLGPAVEKSSYGTRPSIAHVCSDWRHVAIHNPDTPSRYPQTNPNTWSSLSRRQESPSLVLENMTLKSIDLRSREREHLDDLIAELEAELTALKRRRNLLAPIAILPLDVLLLIFGMLKPLVEGSSFGMLLAVTHVCSLWRQEAIHTQFLWDTITPTYHRDATKEILSRSGDLTPLNILINFNRNVDLHTEGKKSPPDGLGGVLDLTKSRVRYIEMKTSQRISSDWFEQATVDLFKSALPHLQTLILGCVGERQCEEHDSRCGLALPACLFEDIPSLQHLELWHCYVSWQDSVSLLNLTTFVVTDPNSLPQLPILIAMLSHMPNLSRLHLVRCLPFTSESFAEPSDTSLGSLEMNLSLPSLTDLSIVDYPSDVPAFLTTLNPSSPNLIVSICMDEGSHFIQNSAIGPFLSRYWRLKSLISIAFVEVPKHENGACRVLFHSTPEISAETTADFSVTSGWDSSKEWFQQKFDELCWRIVDEMQPTVEFALVETIHVDIPLKREMWVKLSTWLPGLSTLSHIQGEQSGSSCPLTDALSITFLDVVDQEKQAATAVPVLFSQVKTFRITLAGPSELHETGSRGLLFYAKRRHHLGIRCREIRVYVSSPLSNEFACELKEYADKVEVTVDGVGENSEN